MMWLSKLIVKAGWTLLWNENFRVSSQQMKAWKCKNLERQAKNQVHHTQRCFPVPRRRQLSFSLPLSFLAFGGHVDVPLCWFFYWTGNIRFFCFSRKTLRQIHQPALSCLFLFLFFSLYSYLSIFKWPRMVEGQQDLRKVLGRHTGEYICEKQTEVSVGSRKPPGKFSR